MNRSGPLGQEKPLHPRWLALCMDSFANGCNRSIKGWVCCPILYGGSVNPNNLSDFLSVENVNGALVGGAALKVELWNAMVALCKR